MLYQLSYECGIAISNLGPQVLIWFGKIGVHVNKSVYSDIATKNENSLIMYSLPSCSNPASILLSHRKQKYI